MGFVNRQPDIHRSSTLDADPRPQYTCGQRRSNNTPLLRATNSPQNSRLRSLPCSVCGQPPPNNWAARPPDDAKRPRIPRHYRLGINVRLPLLLSAFRSLDPAPRPAAGPPNGRELAWLQLRLVLWENATPMKQRKTNGRDRRRPGSLLLTGELSGRRAAWRRRRARRRIGMVVVVVVGLAAVALVVLGGSPSSL
jgi:hypothetical protein